MTKVYGFFAEGSEEVEFLAVVDVLLRGGIEVKTVSVTGERLVESAHHIRLETDALFSEIDCRDADVLFLPGGMPGTEHLAAHEGLAGVLKDAAAHNRRIAAICAAPSVLGRMGLLKGKRATCYPGFETQLTGAVYTSDGVVTDGNVTTARGLGYALDLGLELVRLLKGEEQALQVKKSIQYDHV